MSSTPLPRLQHRSAHQHAQFWPGVTVPQLPPMTGVPAGTVKDGK